MLASKLRIYLAILFAILPSCRGLSQASAVSSTNLGADRLDPSVIVQASLAAMGGESAIASIEGVHAVGTMVLGDGDAKRHIAFVWDDEISASGFEFRDETRENENVHVFVSGHGSPALSVNGSLRKLFSHVQESAPPMHLPALLLLRGSKDTNIQNAKVTREVLNGATSVRLRVAAASVDSPVGILKVQDWYLDQLTGLPTRVDYRVPSTLDASQFEEASAVLSDYRKVDGVYFPFHLEAFEDGKPVSVVTIDSISINPALSPATFEIPGAAQ